MKWLFFVYFILFSKFSVASTCPLIHQVENGSLYNCHKIKVLKLKGDAKSKGLAYGQMVQSGHLFNDLVYRFSNSIVEGMRKIPVIGNTLLNQMDHAFSENYKKRAPEMTRELQAYARLIDLDETLLFRGLSAPDLGAVSPALSSQSLWKRFLTLVFGCSSASYSDGQGRFIHGRNLDYNGYGVFDRESLMVIRYPEPGTSELIRVGFTTESFPFSSITGMNEKGITFSLHQIYSDVDTLYDGTPILSLGEKVLSQARNLEEAVNLVKANRPSPLWRVILSNLNTGQVVTLSVSKEHVDRQDFNKGIFASSNHLSPESPLYKNNHLTYGLFKNSFYRIKKMKQLIGNYFSKNKNDESFESMVKILNYQKNDFLASYEDVIKPHTIQSVIWEKTGSHQKQKIYVSNEWAPASSGSFVEFNEQDLFASFNSKIHAKTKSQNLDKNLRNHHLNVIAYMEEAFRIMGIYEPPTLPVAKNIEDFFSSQKENISPSLILMKAISFHHIRKFKKSNQALESIDWKNLPDHVQETFAVIKIFNLFYLGKKQEAIHLTKSLQKRGLCDPFFEELLLDFLHTKNKNKYYLKRVNYLVASGTLSTGFYKIDDLENRSCQGKITFLK